MFYDFLYALYLKEAQSTKFTYTHHSLSCRRLLLLNTHIMLWRLVQLGFAQISLFTVSFNRVVVSTCSEKKESPNEFSFLTRLFSMWYYSIHLQNGNKALKQKTVCLFMVSCTRGLHRSYADCNDRCMVA
jgi:hypothetical protein